jgi:pimeloyl-ACP methyl ester carboxylesterase
MAHSDPHVDLDEVVKVLAEQHLDHLLAQVGAYFTNDELRASAQARVAAAVTPDTRVVVAHSLGTVVAYETLCHHPEWPVTDFVTLGSPLGGEVVFANLRPEASEGVGVWPGAVRRWTNIRNADDPACAVSLLGRFDGPLVERAVDNGHRVHDPEPYLNNREAGQAVAGALTGE